MMILNVIYKIHWFCSAYIREQFVLMFFYKYFIWLTNVAIGCGFSDLAHLSRTFRRFFGHALSEFFSFNKNVVIEHCD